MSIGSFGGIQGSAAGAPLSQVRGGDADRAQQSTASERVATADKKSEMASGIGTTEADQEAGERDADGRRLYEDTGEQQSAGDEATEPSAAGEPPKVKDPTGQAGTQLDLTG
ncbi:hypothetical protein [Aeoliella sp. SH292]|uniref:hypothetical protein n=1 Tax=Aeoliella sp. SH292 TaxID=3454464 RepID=UPI003F9CF563